MAVASFAGLALMRFAASLIVFKGSDWEPVFLSLPVLALTNSSSAEPLRDVIVIVNNNKASRGMSDGVLFMFLEPLHLRAFGPASDWNEIVFNVIED